MKLRWWVPAIAVFIVVAAGALWTMGLLAPRSINRPPTLVEVPPLPLTARSSRIVTPIVIPLSAIRDAIEQQVPRNLSSQDTSNTLTAPNVPGPPFNWSLTREPFAIVGSPTGLTLSSTLRGSIHASSGMMGPQGGPPGGFPGMPPQGFPGGPPSLPASVGPPVSLVRSAGLSKPSNSMVRSR